MPSTTLSALSRDWLGQTADYRPSAFWFWNASMDPDEMAGFVEEMARAGIREFLIHPVHGMEIEYLSDEFFDRYRLALRLAKQHNLKVWVYDEFGWPSGVAGGKVLREHPEHKGWYLRFDHDEHGDVAAYPAQSDRVMDNVMGAPWTRSETGYIDTLSVEAVRCFIDSTYERIRDECGDLFSEVITGFFTDEPVAMADHWTGLPGVWQMIGLPWTPVFPARFREHFGYDIEPHYAELAGDGPSQLKRDYWQLAKEMHAEAYHRQLGRWCREHGVKYTGHVGEDVLLMQVRFAGSMFECLSQMDEPGTDFLGNGPDAEDRFVEQVIVQSIARHAGKNRVYCEAHGITPYDIRLSSMLQRMEMMGIHGINDIALMGFQQGLHGIRKRSYWPPIFREAPWWPFYPEFRDACARSIGLTSLGARRARYAILYPQDALEQVDVFTNPFTGEDPVTGTIQQLGLAIYEAGETFEFVFPEILGEARVENGSIIFPHGQYESVLFPAQFSLDKDSAEELQRLTSEGGTVLRRPLEELLSWLRGNETSWSSKITVETDGGPGDIRIFEFSYPDGDLFVFRNVTDSPKELKLTSPSQLSEWDVPTGEVISCGNSLILSMEPRTCRYLAVSTAAIGTDGTDGTYVLPIETQWAVRSESPNTARPANVAFLHDELGWLQPEELFVPGKEHGALITIPRAFAGKTSIPFRGDFRCAQMPCPRYAPGTGAYRGSTPAEMTLGILFEKDHLDRLSVNGTEVDLTAAVPAKAWDSTCRCVDIRGLLREGTNTVNGTLRFQEFETQFGNHAFFAYHPMPTLDLFVTGSFRLLDGVIEPDTGDAVSLPLSLSDAGWAQYSGIVTLSSEFSVSPQLAGNVRGLLVEPVSEDCIEVLVDGVSIGKRIRRPYRFDIAGLSPGNHSLQLRISSVSANTVDVPSPWGVKSVGWLVKP